MGVGYARYTELGIAEIGNIKPTHIKRFYALLKEKGLSNSTIKLFHSMLLPCFELAVNDDMIRKNPAKNCLEEYKGGAKEKTALTLQEQTDLLRFVSESNVYNTYEPIIRYMLGTGCRIGDDDDKIRLNQRKPSKYKGLRRFGPEKNLQRINKFMKERPIFYKNLIQMKENFRFYLRCFYCITKVVILQFNSENRTELARNG